MNESLYGAWHSRCGTYDVSLTRACFEKMKRLALAHAPREVGTALVGHYSDDQHHATVTDLAPLTEDSRGSRFSFHRGGRGLMNFFRSLLTTSRGRIHYVGEWHSHPGGAPSPSGTDDENTLAIARDLSEKCPECILVILALDGDRVELGAFVYSRTRGRIDLVPASLACASAERTK